MEQPTTQSISLLKKFDKYLFIIIIIAILAFLVQVYFVSQIKFIGSSDPAIFSNVAENVIKGKGFVMDIINEYFIKFPTVTHPEEWGFPGVSLILIPFILLFGKTAFAIKLPSMIAGVILFPILTYYLGKEFFNKRIGFLAAISTMFYPMMFSVNIGGERDTLFALFAVAGIYFFYKGLKKDEIKVELPNVSLFINFFKGNKYFLLMGAFLGYAYLIRQVALVIFPVLIIIYYLINKKISKNFLYGIGIGALVMAPWLIRNYLVFGNPLFTVNTYVGWLVGYAPYSQPALFQIYWESPKPSLSSLAGILGPGNLLVVYANKVFTNLVGQFTGFIVLNILTFVGIVFSSSRNITKRFSALAILLVTSGLIFSISLNLLFEKVGLAPRILVGIPYLGMLLILWLYFGRERKEHTIFITLLGAFAFFFSIVWVFDLRYWLVLVPFLLIYSWAALETILKKIGERAIVPQPSLEQVGKLLTIFLVIFILFGMSQTFGKFFDKNTQFPYGDENMSIAKMALAEKIKTSTDKDAVIMNCDTGVFNFYNNRKAVVFPSADLDAVIKIMRTYNVSYFTLLSCDRRGIDIKLYRILFKDGITRADNDSYGPDIFLTTDYEKGQIYKVALPAAVLSNIYKVQINRPSSLNSNQNNSYDVSVSVI